MHRARPEQRFLPFRVDLILDHFRDVGVAVEGLATHVLAISHLRPIQRRIDEEHPEPAIFIDCTVGFADLRQQGHEARGVAQ